MNHAWFSEQLISAYTSQKKASDDPSFEQIDL